MTSRDDVVRAAGRLFAERGYHGTSMRDLGRALGLHGSSLYAHVSSKEDLLVDIVGSGADLFDSVGTRTTTGTGAERLADLVSGHLDVVLDHVDEARTFLNEARALDAVHRAHILERRDRYEARFREVITSGIEDGTIRAEVDPKLSAILLLSILNSVERWYRPDGQLDRRALAAGIVDFTMRGIAGSE